MASSDPKPVEESNLNQQPDHQQPPANDEKKKTILEKLNDENNPVIIIHGEAGVGKTWLAREVSKQALALPMDDSNTKKSLFCASLWLSLNKKYQHDEPMRRDKFLLEDLARQLTLLPRLEGGEADDIDGFAEEEAELEKQMGNLKDLILRRLEDMMGRDESKRQLVLFVLDSVPEDVGYDVRKEIVESMLGEEKIKGWPVRVLATRRDYKFNSGFTDVSVEALKEAEFCEFVKGIGDKVGLEERDDVAAWFGEAVFKRGVISLPAAVAVLVVKALKYNFEHVATVAREKTKLVEVVEEKKPEASSTVAKEKKQAAQVSQEKKTMTQSIEEEKQTAQAAGEKKLAAQASEEKESEATMLEEKVPMTEEKKPTSQVTEETKQTPQAIEEKKPMAQEPEKTKLVATSSEEKKPIAQTIEEQKQTPQVIEEKNPIAMSSKEKKMADQATEEKKLAVEEKKMAGQAAEEKELKALASKENKSAVIVAEEKNPTTMVVDEKKLTTIATEEKKLTVTVIEEKNPMTKVVEEKEMVATTAREKKSTTTTSEENKTVYEEEDEKAVEEEKELSAQVIEEKKLSAQVIEEKNLEAQVSEEENHATMSSEEKNLAAQMIEENELAVEEKKLAGHAVREKQPNTSVSEEKNVATEEKKASIIVDEEKNVTTKMVEEKTLAAITTEQKKSIATTSEENKAMCEDEKKIVEEENETYREKKTSIENKLVSEERKVTYDEEKVAWMVALEAWVEKKAGAEEKTAMRLVRFACFDTLPASDKAMVECSWHCRKFYHLGGNRSVHYNELIAHWILEGYLNCGEEKGKECSVVEAYEKGYRVLQELCKRGVLKVQEDDDFVSMEWLALEVKEKRLEGFYEMAMLGLPCAFAEEKGDGDWRGFGKIAVADGMIKTVYRRNKWEKVSTLFIDGERLSHEVPEKFFERPKEVLEVLIVSNPRLKDLNFIGMLSKLSMLVLRGCDMLYNVDTIKELKMLYVLEISGAKSLIKIIDDVFETLTQLRSLNLADSSLKSLPSSFSKLSQLRWLVLRGCSRLTQIPSMKAFTNLEMLDVSKSYCWTTFKDRDLGKLEKLKVMDFSHSRIAPLPFVHSLSSLTRLSLKGCVEITRLPHLDHLKDLQVLEVPGAEKLKEFYNPCLENKLSLRILDLSGTKITSLPKSFNDLPLLESLNLSQMSNLTNFLNVSFEKFTSLKRLNISNNKAKSLPSFSGLGGLRELDLSDCQHLEELSEMKGLTSLEILDLSRAYALKTIPDQELIASRLHKLLLPGCKVLEKIPILIDPVKLEILNLSGCEAMTEVEKQHFQEMLWLQKLDLSSTKVTKLTKVSSPSKIRQLLLENCTELSEMPPLGTLEELEDLNLCGVKNMQKLDTKNLSEKLRVLNLSNTSISNLDIDLSKCTNLKELSLRVRDISKLKPELDKLTSLKVLELGVEDPDNQAGSKPSLDLKDFSALQCLTTLHLEGFQAKTFPYWISKLVNLTSLRLPDLKDVKELDWGKITRLPNDLNWEKCGIFKIKAYPKPTRLSISMKGTKMFEVLKQEQYQNVWDSLFAEFRIYVCPFIGTPKDDDVYRLREEKFFEEIYMKMISCPDNCKRFLEIRGFENRPEGLDEDAFKRVECLSFIEDNFLTNLSDIEATNLEAMRGLWLERCPKIKSFFSSTKKFEFGAGSFNILWASNLPSLTELYCDNLEDNIFKNLTQLYLDCCPNLKFIFTLAQLPENLERLEAKFCGKLEALFKSGDSKEQPELKNLREIYLLYLPELTEIGFKFPCVEKAKVKGCPKLEEKKFHESLGVEKSENIKYVKEN